METKTIVQKIKKIESSTFDKAFKYYSLLFTINDLHLTQREIQLVAFTATKGNISYHREEFCKTFNSSSPTINNMISKLKKSGILIKDAGKIKVNPQIVFNFEQPIVLQISLLNG